MVQEFDTSVKLTQEDNQGVIDWMAQYFKFGEKDKIGFTRDFVARMNNTYASVADGKYIEMVTHDILPKIPFTGKIADMFLQKRTSIESYKRDQVYDSDWRLWPQLYEGNTVVSQNQVITGEEITNMGARRIISRLNNVLFLKCVKANEKLISILIFWINLVNLFKVKEVQV